MDLKGTLHISKHSIKEIDSYILKKLLLVKSSVGRLVIFPAFRLDFGKKNLGFRY